MTMDKPEPGTLYVIVKDGLFYVPARGDNPYAGYERIQVHTDDIAMFVDMECIGDKLYNLFVSFLYEEQVLFSVFRDLEHMHEVMQPKET